MLLDNKIYDVLKWLVLIFLPALAVLVKGLGDLYSLDHADLYVQTLNLLTVFLGSIMQVSSNYYHNQDGFAG